MFHFHSVRLIYSVIKSPRSDIEVKCPCKIWLQQILSKGIQLELLDISAFHSVLMFFLRM